MEPQLIGAIGYFANSFLATLAGSFCAYLGMDACFEKRKSTVLFWMYFLVKCTVWAVSDTLYLIGVETPELSFAWSVVVAVFGVASYFVLYYTWDGSFCKVGLAAFATDGIAGISTLSAVTVAQAAYDWGHGFDYRGEFGVTTFVIAGLSVVVFAALRWLAGPVVKWFRDVSFVHEQAWTVGITAAIAIAALSRLQFGEFMSFSIVVGAVMGALLLFTVFAMVVQQLGSERRRRSILEREMGIMHAYDLAIREQSQDLETGITQLDMVSAALRRTHENATAHADLQEHVVRLKELCDSMRHGIYSDCPALDAVLVHNAEEFERHGLQVQYRISPLGTGAAQAALVVQALLGWALDVYSQEDGLQGREAGCQQSEGAADVVLRVVRKGNQLVVVQRMPSKRRVRFPRRVVEKSVADFVGAVIEADDGVHKTVRVLVGQ